MIDLTGDDSNDEAPPPSLVEQLQSFTGASEADAAAALAAAQGSLEGAAAALQVVEAAPAAATRGAPRLEPSLLRG